METQPIISFDNTEIAFESKSNYELKRAWYLFKIIGNPWLVKAGKVFTQLALNLRIPIGWALRGNIYKQFCGGENIAQCAQATKVLDKFRIGTILDYSIEGKEEETELDHTKNQILETLHTAAGNIHIPFCVFKVTGIARFALLEKVNENSELSAEESSEWQRAQNRVEEICKRAYETGTPVFIDAEDSWIQGAIDRLTETMMEKYNRDKAIVFNTVQLYRHDRLSYLKKSIEIAKKVGYKTGFKLVRGAYMEKERKRALEKGYADPIQPDKQNCDRDFNLALEYCTAHIDDASLCAGTHNEESSLHLVQLMRTHNISPADKRIYFAQLLGMSDHISFNLAHAGYNVAKYVPYGPINDVIPYLIRRAEENTSVKGQIGRELSLIQKELSRRKLS